MFQGYHRKAVKSIVRTDNVTIARFVEEKDGRPSSATAKKFDLLENLNKCLSK